MQDSLFSYEPDTYKKSEVMRNILKPQEKQLGKARERQKGIAEDMHPSQTIRPELWEREFAIKPVGMIEQRRKNILAKIRGAGTVTLQMVRDIVEAYTEGIVTPTEDNDDSMIHIEIESTSATIVDADIMEAQLYETIPAHMDFRYTFKRPICGRLGIAAAIQSTTVRRIGD